MGKAVTIQDKEYLEWIKDLGTRFRRSQIKAAVKVNEEMLRFYWELGHDIVERDAENHYGSRFFSILSHDLKEATSMTSGLSERNIRYAKDFYLLYSQEVGILQQPAAKSDLVDVTKDEEKLQQPAAKSNDTILPQLVEQIKSEIFSVPWGHHMLLIDKCKNAPQKALFFVHQTMQNGWSRNMLLNFLDTDLYERQGKALTNFSRTLPDETSDLAQELTKDPYDFAFTGITGKYNERLLKDKLLNNITQFLVELGTGFAYVGKEYRLQIGDTENFIDLLFYNLNLSCYVVIEVKIGKFEFADAGQLGGYVVACNHILKKEGRDNPTIGILICKEKDSLVAQYALEASSQPLGISEYELAKLYPEKVEGTIPTIEEIEQNLGERIKNDKD
jgi:predicted nuclease of restriction endonuclease-like (RecB) superfamily